MSGQVMSFDDKHDKGIELFMAVDQSQQVPRIPLCKHLWFIVSSWDRQPSDQHVPRAHTSVPVEGDLSTAPEQ